MCTRFLTSALAALVAVTTGMVEFAVASATDNSTKWPPWLLRRRCVSG